MTLSLCIAGCGGYARSVLDAVSDMNDEFEFYFASRDEAKAREYCDTYDGAGYFCSYEEAAADPRVEAMYFFTPHDMHLGNARMAAGHGKHVLMEKPIARTTEEAGRMIEAVESANVKLMVAENYRFLPAVARTRELMDEGELGELRLIQIYNEGIQTTSGWRTSLDSVGGGVFIDGGIHGVDILVNIGGLPDSVFALQPPKVNMQSEGEDGMVMVAKLPDGGVGLINYSAATAASESRQGVEVTFSKGVVRFDPFGVDLTVSTRDGERTEALEDGRSGALRAMLREFRDSIVESREPAMSARDGLRDLAVVLAAYRSVATSEEVGVESP
jgi:predicted dehydrogenase